MTRWLVLAAALGGAGSLPAQDFRVADSIAESGVRRGVYPGAVLIIGRRDAVLHERGFGHLTWNAPLRTPDPDSTLWDLASLTKVIGTAMAMATLIESRRIGLDDPVVRHLPRFTGDGRDAITIRQLLNHTSGLRSYAPFYRQADSRDSAVALIYGERPRGPPGKRAEYSDINYLLLGLLVERVTGESLERYVGRAVLEPAGLRHTGYRIADSMEQRTAPTGQWRGRPVCCRVNDQNAVRMGGAAGHAGLFSTGEDLARFARLWLGEGTLERRRVLAPWVVRTFLTADTAVPTRYLGWERPDPEHRDDTAFGGLLSDQAYGHTGWTGTQLWIDPSQDLFVVFLTNRSFAPRMGDSIRQLRGIRGALANAVVRAAAP